jgi:glycosyltransferase involved in cell wall biosynthesis
LNIWILAVSEPLPMLDGSFREFRCSLLAHELVDRGHHVTWWTSDHDHMRKAARFGTFTSLPVGPRLQLNLLPGPLYRRNISLRRVIHNRAVAREFLEHAGKAQTLPEIVFACLPTLELAEAAIIYGKAHEVPVVVDIRDQWPDIYLSVFPALLRPALRWLLNAEFRRAGHIVANAYSLTAVSETYLAWGLRMASRARRIEDRVYPLGYHARSQDGEEPERGRHFKESHGIASDSLVVTFIGTFGASYDLETVVHAASKLSKSRAQRLHFVLAGDGDRATLLRRLARGVRNITFTGWLDAPAMATLLSISDIGLAAYATQALQSLPNKLFEYMAAGIPVLSSLTGEQQHLLASEAIGLHYIAHDQASLIAQLDWFAEHPAERAAMGARARDLFSQRYSAHAVYLDLVAHLEAVSNRSYIGESC